MRDGMDSAVTEMVLGVVLRMPDWEVETGCWGKGSDRNGVESGVEGDSGDRR